MSNYDAVVIGAGNGGLTSAVTMAQQGLKVLLLEKHNVPGGCATSFCRGRFEFEVALHQLSAFGSVENPGPLRKQLKKLGVVDQLQWVAMDNLYRVALPEQGLDITLPADRGQLVKTLQERFPEEKESITGFLKLIRRWMMEMVGVLSDKPEATREKYPVFFKYALKSYQEVLDEYFRDPLLKLTLGVYWCYAGVPPSCWSFTNAAAMIFGYLEFKPYHLLGGSQALSNALVDVFTNSGGQVRFNCGVKKILVEDGGVTGVLTEAGEVIAARCVVSNASAVDTYVEMIDRGQVPDKQLEVMGGSSIGPSALTIYIGLDCDPSEIGISEATNFLCTSSDMEQTYRSSRHLDGDPGMVLLTCYDAMDPNFSAEGVSQVSIVLLKYAEPWTTIPPGQYYDTKYRLADGILNLVERHFPGFRGHIEEIEVATPLTFMRYLGTPRGAIYGFDQFAKDSNYFVSPQSPIRGLYLAGAWVGDGGFQPALQSGVTAAKAAVRDFRNR